MWEGNSRYKNWFCEQISISITNNIIQFQSATSEVCVGVVKAAPIHKKSPSQHFSDLLMLSAIGELKPVFQNLMTCSNKSIDCVRVDGATDEGPSHHQVQYWWTEWHVRKNIATLLTTCSSGSPYLNRVELAAEQLSLLGSFQHFHSLHPLWTKHQWRDWTDRSSQIATKPLSCH